MATISDGFKDVFLAGVGAMAITGEKAKELVDQLIAKGEISVDQGKQINTELKHKVGGMADAVRRDMMESRIAAMAPEERVTFVAEVIDIVAKANASTANVGDASAVKTSDPAEAVPVDHTKDETAPQTPTA